MLTAWNTYKGINKSTRLQIEREINATRKLERGANHVAGIKMSVAIEPSLLIGHFTFIDRLAPPEWLRVLPPEGLEIPPVLPRPGATALLPITVRLQCEDAVHHPGALPSLRPERQKDTSRSHGLHESVCRKQGCGDKLLQLQAKPSGGAPPDSFRHEPAPNRRPRSTAGRSPAPPPGSCARSRSTGTPTAPRRRPAAPSPPPCSRPPARTRVAQRAPSRHSGDGGGNERDK